MTPARRRNLLRAPAVLLVRFPLLAPLAPLALLSALGAAALAVGVWLGRRLPAFEHEV